MRYDQHVWDAIRHHRRTLGYGQDITWGQALEVVRRLWRIGENGR